MRIIQTFLFTILFLVCFMVNFLASMPLCIIMPLGWVLKRIGESMTYMMDRYFRFLDNKDKSEIEKQIEDIESRDAIKKDWA